MSCEFNSMFLNTKYFDDCEDIIIDGQNNDINITLALSVWYFICEDRVL